MNVLEGLQDQSSEKKIRIVHLKTKKDIAMLIEKNCTNEMWGFNLKPNPHLRRF